MEDTTDYRAINTPDLEVLWRKAGPGKRPGRTFMDILNKDGIHILWVRLPLMNDGSEHRLGGYASVVGQEEPVEFEIDMLVSDFNRLTTVDSLLPQDD